MKNLITALFLTIVLTAVSFAQGAPKPSQGNPRVLLDTSKGKVAVLLFDDAAGIGPVGLQKMQNGIASSLRQTMRFEVADTGKTNSATRNGNLQITQLSPSTAVKIGKLLGVNYVLTGVVTACRPTKDGAEMTVETKLFNIGTGQVETATITGHTTISNPSWTATGSNTWNGPVTLGSSSVIGSDPKVLEKVMKPVIQKLTASLKAANL